MVMERVIMPNISGAYKLLFVLLDFTEQTAAANQTAA
jgi:hypothetical protein